MTYYVSSGTLNSTNSTQLTHHSHTDTANSFKALTKNPNLTPKLTLTDTGGSYNADCRESIHHVSVGVAVLSIANDFGETLLSIYRWIELCLCVH